MKAKYSKSTCGVYLVGVSKNIPDDALDIPATLYARFTHAELDKFDVFDGVVVEYVAPPPTPEQLQAKVNTKARAYLLSTDWYVWRFADTGVPIPDDIKTKRQEARDAII